MAEKASQGQADKAATEARTAEVAAENKQTLEGKPDDASAAERLSNADPDAAMEVALDPYPPYEAKSVDELRSAAEARGVEINRDVEKAELVKEIRAKDPTNAALDFMTLEDLRALAADKGVELDDEFVKAQLVTELRAADTGVNNPGDHAL